MTWNAGLAGELFDLQQMATTFGEGDPTVRVGADDNYVLESSTFDAFEYAAGVKAEAERRLELMNGAMRALNANAGLVWLTGRFWDSDTPHVVVVPGTAHSQVTTTSAAVGVVTVDGHVIDPPPPPARGWFALAESNPNVADVLRLRATGPLDWANLFKIVEIIKWDVKGARTGSKEIVSRGWATPAQLSAFGASANREDVSGDAARHARLPGDVPTNVMTLDEGRSFVQGLVQAWLGYLNDRGE